MKQFLKSAILKYGSAIAACAFAVVTLAARAEVNLAEVTGVPFPVTINGIKMEKNEEYPLLFHKNIVYIPTTYNLNCFTGLRVEFYEERRTQNATHFNKIYIGIAHRNADTYAEYPVQNPLQKKSTAVIHPEIILVNKTHTVDDIKNTARTYPVVNFRNVLYLPMSYDIACEMLDWKLDFSEEKGLSIDTTNPNRPVIDKEQSEKLGYLDPTRGLNNLEYVYSENAYAGYPLATHSYFFEFRYKARGEAEKKYSIPLTGADFFLNRKTITGMDTTVADIPPRLDENGVLHIHCVAGGKNVLVHIDMLNGKLLSVEDVN